MYSVYKHTCPNNKVYIGMTCQIPKKRWQNGKSYKENCHFNNAINKYGWENIKHEIIACNLTKEEAEELEIYLINFVYNSNNRDFGYNIEYGGCHHGKTSEETKKKISESNKGKRNSPRTEFKKGHITKLNKEARKRISDSKKGKHASIETEFKKGHKPFNAKKIMCVETKIIYNSIKEASRETKIMDCHICEVCKGRRKSAGNLHWEYVD